MTEQVVQSAGKGAGTRAPGPPRPHFAGRERELRALDEDTTRAGLHTLSGHPSPYSRVLLVAGAPGSGRTTLAEEFVHRLCARTPGTVLRARLTDPGGTAVPTERTARDLLAALESSRTPQAGADEEALSAALRAELADRAGRDGRPLVLLLDDVARSQQVLDLLPESRGCLVVAVSSGPLTQVPDVRPCTLGGLDRAAAVSLLARRAGSAPRLTVDPRGAETLAELCGDLPAALALVGGWFGARPKLSVADAVALLRQVPDTPVPRGRPGPSAEADGAVDAGNATDATDAAGTADAADAADAPDGEHTADAEGAAGAAGVGDVADPETDAEDEHPAPPGPPAPYPPAPLVRAFRLVNGSLTGSHARLLRLLSLAPAASVDPLGASALAGCSVAAAHAALEEFVRLGLLRALGGSRYEVPGCLDPLLRAELEEHERPDEALLARARLLERTVRRLEACRAVCEPSGSPARKRLAGMPGALRFAHRTEARTWLEARRPELLAAARAAVADSEGRLDTLARRLVSGLARALDAHREPEAAAPELYRLHELVLDVAERGGLHRERAAALLYLGDLDAGTRRLETARARYRTALDSARAGDDPVAAGRALESLGGTYAELGDWERAADWYGRALALRLTRSTPADREAVARLHARLGAVHGRAGRRSEALRGWKAAAAAFRRLGDSASHARALSEAARVQEEADRPQDAVRLCGQALEAARRAGDVRLQAALRMRLADGCERLGDRRAARSNRAAGRRLLAALGEDGTGDGAGEAPAAGDAGPDAAGRYRSG